MKILGFIILFIWVCSVARKLTNAITVKRYLKDRESAFLKAKEMVSEYNAVHYYIAYTIFVFIYLFVVYLSIKGILTL